MAVCRVEKTKDFTVMSNFHLRDEKLSLKAKGMLSQMLSLPDKWDYTIAGLAAICVEGKDAIRATVEELETAGYIQRRQLHAADGSFAGNEYIIYESPQPPLSENPTTGNPLTVNPLPDSTLTGNPTQLNKDLIKNVNNTPLPPKKQRRSRGPKSIPDWKPERFEAFWTFYPVHTARQAAIAAWDKLKPDDDLIAAMGKALRRQKESRQWLDGIGIPYPATWINGRRWQDEVQAGPEPPGAYSGPKVVERGQVNFF